MSNNIEFDKLLNYLHHERDTWYRCAHEPGTDCEYQSYARGRYTQCEAMEAYVGEMLKSHTIPDLTFRDEISAIEYINDIKLASIKINNKV